MAAHASGQTGDTLSLANWCFPCGGSLGMVGVFLVRRFTRFLGARRASQAPSTVFVGGHAESAEAGFIARLPWDTIAQRNSAPRHKMAPIGMSTRRAHNSLH